ncbi:MAG TPA: DUF4253 domain-containing protein [Pseudonocardiaceae bacterium]|nr:DUF4253 domain-containing protein [Pseudonocardiaceae bacterium]
MCDENPKQVFAELGVPLPELESWHTADTVVFGFPVAAGEAEAVWQRLRAVFDRSGMWPFISTIGPEEWQLNPERGEEPTRAYLREALRLDPERVVAETVEGERVYFGYDTERDGLDLYDLDQILAELGPEPISPEPPRYRFATHYSNRALWMYLVRAEAGYAVPALVCAPTWARWPEPGEESPHVALHDVAFLRSWQDRFGAELQSIGRTDLEVVVARPPRETRDIARVAIEQYAYCFDLCQILGEPVQLAHTQVPGDRWYFWWD